MWGRRRRTTKAKQAGDACTGGIKATHGAAKAKQTLRIKIINGTHKIMQHGGKHQRTSNNERGQRTNGRIFLSCII